MQLLLKRLARISQSVSKRELTSNEAYSATDILAFKSLYLEETDRIEFDFSN